MKKLGLMFLSITLLLSFCALPFGANAQVAKSEERIISETVEMLEDGYYVKTIVAEELPAMAPRATTTKSGSKSYVLANNNGEELARFTLKGTFSVNTGVSATSRHRPTQPRSQTTRGRSNLPVPPNRAIRRSVM